MYSLLVQPSTPTFPHLNRTAEEQNTLLHQPIKFHSKSTATIATKPPTKLARTVMIDEADVVDLVLPADVVEEPEPEPEPDVPDVPDVPLVTDVASPGRLTVAWLASAWKAERVLFVAALWFVRKVIWERRSSRLTSH